MNSASSRPLRVLRVMGRTNVGGPALQATVLQRALVPPEFETLLVVGRIEDGEADYFELRAPDIAHEMLGWGGRLPAVSDIHAFVRLLRLARRFKPDIVHTHTAKAGVLGRLVAIICRVPIRVHTFHGHLLHGYFQPRLTRLVIGVERLLAQRTTGLIAVGERVRDDLISAGIGTPEKFRVVAPGVPLAALLALDPTDRSIRDELGIPVGARVVGYVGRLVPVKRIDRLAEVIAGLADAADDLEFVVVGDGPERAALSALPPHVQKRLHLLGWRGDIAAVLGAMDVVVNTSENEGMPVALIEAGAAAKPVVATDVGSTCEVVAHDETGIVLPYDRSAFIAQTLTLLDDPALRSAMGERARVRVTDRFGDERLAADMAEVYKRLAGGQSIKP